MSFKLHDTQTQPETGLQDDRRRNYRIEVDEIDLPVHAELTLSEGNVATVEIINYSLAGILFYASPDLQIEIDDLIPKIRLKFARKPPVDFTGEVVRLEKGKEKLFCGIRFFKNKPKGMVSEARKLKKTNGALSDAVKMKWIHVLKELPNYIQIEAFDEQAKAEKEAYDVFQGITGALSVEERWWFFEMLDELKRKEPVYPPRLLDEFAIICEWGYAAIPARPEWNRSKFGFFKKICLFFKSLFYRP